MNNYKYPHARNSHLPNRFYNQEYAHEIPAETEKNQVETQSHPSTKVLLEIAAKKVFRLKTIPILFNYFLRKSGLAGTTKRLEEQTVKAASAFFE